MSDETNKDQVVKGDIAKILEESKRKEVPTELYEQCLSTALFEIHKTSPFYGSVLQVMNIWSTYSLPTAGVSFNNDLKRWDMAVNPYFFCKRLNAEQRNGVLLHEILHVVHRHPFRVAFTEMPPRKRRIMNVAMDMAINQFIKGIPAGCDECKDKDHETYKCSNEDCCGRGIFVEDFYDENDKGKKTYWPKGETAEQYYERLLTRFDDPDENGEDGDQDGEGDGEGKEGKGGGKGKGKPTKGKGGKGNAGGGAQSNDIPDTLDSHNWDGSGEEKDMIDATQDLFKRAMQKQNFGYSDLPSAVRDMLDQLDSRRNELNYKAMILMAMRSSLPSNIRKHSWTRKSRRYGEYSPGTRNGENPKLETFIDTSGSISVEEANEFLDIIDELLKVGARECNLNMFHTANYYSEKYKLGKRIKREEIQSGGTDLAESMAVIAKKRPDLAVILTDGYFGSVDTQALVGHGNKFPRTIFVISKEGDVNHPFSKEDFCITIKIPNGRGNDRR